ncbi:MAG: protein kinase [Gemmataceae bacterium]
MDGDPRFSHPDHVTLLTSPSWSHCEGLIKAFENAWRQGRAPAIGDYLRVDGPLRLALLIELVHIDLELRLKAGEPTRIERYLEAHPELAAAHEVVADLVAAEFRLRHSHEGDVGPDEYRNRFPALPGELIELLRQQRPADTVNFPRAAAAPPVAPPAVPGYELVGEVGRGGMGVIYKAREPSLDRFVALKFLPPEYSRDPDRLGRFLREARTASALNHPHICTVHALGEHEGRPFLVMEFIEGDTLQALVARRVGVPEAARLVGQAARALAAAHAAGVVHRDIKPENVMVRADGLVKVVDFGLARRLPTLAAPVPDGNDTSPGMFLGTAAYMSPEQARGEPVDSASDVFSLGIVLYQLATGSHPFEADSALGMMYAITTRQPVPPSRLNPKVPAALDGLIEAMLRKAPRLRPTADETVATLEGLSRGVPAQPAATVRPIVRRESELSALRAALAAADTGRGSFVCVAGEPGIGKTTLVEAFLDELATGRPPDPECLVARGHCSERLGGTEAYLPVIEALTGLLRGGEPSVARLMKATAPTWHSQLVPAARDAAPPRWPARAFTQQAMLLEFSTFLEEVSRLNPVVLFFDDVHWADVSTVDLLAHLGARCRALRVLVILTYRPTELLLARHPFHTVKLELLGKGVCAECTLGFLDRGDVDRYLALAFPGHAFPADLADLLHARTEGSPLFLADLLRYLSDRGVIAESGGRWSLAREVPDWSADLPQSVRSMVQRKIERLDEADRRLLAAASVQGHEFDSAAVAAALALDPAEVEDRLQALDRVHRLVRLEREYEFPDRTLTLRYAFVHSLYQQALYNDLPPRRRASLSAAVARALEWHHGDGHPPSPPRACLYEVGRDFARAARQFSLAAQSGTAGFSPTVRPPTWPGGDWGWSVPFPVPGTRRPELPLQVTLGLQLQSPRVTPRLGRRTPTAGPAPSAPLAPTRARSSPSSGACGCTTRFAPSWPAPARWRPSYRNWPRGPTSRTWRCKRTRPRASPPCAGATWRRRCGTSSRPRRCTTRGGTARTRRCSGRTLGSSAPPSARFRCGLWATPNRPPARASGRFR